MKIEIIKEHKPIHQIFECLKDFTNVSFLDSSLKKGQGRHSIIGIYPYFSISIQNGKTKVNGKEVPSSFEDTLKDYMAENKSENNTSLPIISGAIGYFSYDYGLKNAGVVSQHKRRLDVPDAFVCFYDVFIIEDHQDNILYVVANGKLKDEYEEIDEVKKLLNLYLKESVDIVNKDYSTMAHSKDTQLSTSNIIPDFEQDEYMKAIGKMKQHILEGDIYVVNMTEQFRIYSEKKPYEVFKILRRLSPSPFGAYIQYENFAIICSSPERFLKVRENKLTTCPIKGTRKRGTTKEEDEKLKCELECSEKEKSELLMVVDLERNDLNKICVPGSVKVKNLFSIESYAQVFHLVSQVEGQLKKNTDVVDILSAMFPGGSITGTPKLSAMKIIDKIEKSSRNLYTGSIGYLAFDGSIDLNIIIRTAVYQKGVYHVGAGGGITYESDEKFEIEEVFQKAQAIFHSILV